MTQFVSQAWGMWHEFLLCPMTRAAISTTRLCDCLRYLTSLCALERYGVRRQLKRMGRVVLIAALLLGCAVPQMCWTSLRGIACRWRHNPSRCTHCEVSIRDCRRQWSDTRLLVACILIAAIRHGRPPWRCELTRVCGRCVCVGLCLCAAVKLHLLSAHVSYSLRIRWACGQLNVCMMCGWLLACCWLLGALHSSAGCLHVVGCRSSLSAGVPTGEPTFVVCVANVSMWLSAIARGCV